VPHGIAPLRFFPFAIQHQEPASTRAAYFLADRAVLLRQFVPAVNPLIADA
jgi:hypothetical protein